MPYIKKIYLEGFKSFARPTELIFDKGLNVIVGPNGSGKSNIIDAICFVLGRLATKSLRAEKASSMIYKGKNPKEKAIVRLILDNVDGIFTIDNEKPPEIIIERTLKKDGSSIYKINGKTKTRNELLELLSQANLNPYGFNIIQQQEIFKFVDMKAIERRKLIEELAGISIYEYRKEKALRELDKTNEKIKEVNTILNEKINFLKNLEKERKQAMLYNKLKEEEANLKFSIIFRKKKEKKEKKEKLTLELENQNKKKKEIEENIEKISSIINKFRKEIEDIDSMIEEISGVELETLQREITELKTQTAKLEVKRNSLINQIRSSEEKIKSLTDEINDLEEEIYEIKEKSKDKMKTSDAEKIHDVEKKIEKVKTKLNHLLRRKEHLESLKKEKEIVKDKLSFLNKEYLNISQSATRKKGEIKKLERSILPVDKNLIESIDELKKKIKANNELIKEREKIISKFEREKEIFEEEIRSIKDLEICPKCKRKMDEKHRKDLIKQLKLKINDIEEKIKGFLSEIKNLTNENDKLIAKEEKAREEQKKQQENIRTEKRIKEEKNNFNLILKRKREIESKLEEINQKLPKLDSELGSLTYIDSEIDETRDNLNMLILEKEKIKNKVSISKKLDLELEIKERDLDNLKNVLYRTEKEKEKAKAELSDLNNEITEMTGLLNQKEEKYREVYEKFSNLINKKNELHRDIIEKEKNISEMKAEISVIEGKINKISVDIAKIEAEISVLENQEKEENFEGKLIKLPLDVLEKKLIKIRERLDNIGKVNLLALETYENVKVEVEDIKKKLEEIKKEEEEIINKIKKIDKEKKKVFINMFNQLNKLFMDNFATLSDKGIAKLILENPKEPFEGGIDIILQIGKGKYFDTNSLSGGEKVLVALAFIFAIQKLNAYPFYIFDEIEAALDKRNSEKLAELLKKHISKQQSIIITHNDATISKADLIYGISMQGGISKAISLKL